MCGQFEELKGKPLSFNDSGGNGNGNGESKSRSKSKSKSQSQKEEEKLPEDYIQKYSDASIIAESILIGNIPYFLVCENGTIEIKETN